MDSTVGAHAVAPRKTVARDEYLGRRSVLRAVPRQQPAVIVALALALAPTEAGAQAAFDVAGAASASTVAHDPAVSAESALDLAVDPGRPAGESAHVPVVAIRGELGLPPSRPMPIAGVTALVGLSESGGWGGGVVAGYFGELTSRPDVSAELLLALEAFGPLAELDALTLRLLARVGAAVMLQPQTTADVVAQLGFAVRCALSEELALLFDLRGELRVRPPALTASEAGALSGGPVLTLGFELRLP